MGKRDGFSKEMREWVKGRDGNKCVLCGAVENLEVHHIIPFRHAVTKGHGTGQGWHLRLVNSPINAVLLCRQEHRGSDDSVHPDAYLALKIYHSDKNSFTKMALKRDDLVREGKVYWQPTHDLNFMEIALENTLKYVLAGNYPPW